MASLDVKLEKLVEQVKLLSEKINKISESQGELLAAVRSMDRGRSVQCLRLEGILREVLLIRLPPR